MAECEASFAGTSCGTSTCSDSIRLEMVASLQTRREELEAKLAAKNEELKLLCIQEAEITGVLPPEIPLEPGETPPTLRRRVGTSFALPESLFNKLRSNEDESLGALELEIKIQTGIAEAALGLANDSSQSKAVRRKHRNLYQQTKGRLSELEIKITQLLLQQQQNGSRSQSPAQQAQPQTQTHTQAYQLQLKQRKKPRPPMDSGLEDAEVSEADGVLHAGGISLSPLGALDRHEPGRLQSALSASTNTVGLPLHPPRHSSYHNTMNQYPTLGACTNAELERFGRRDVVQSGDGMSSSSSAYWGSSGRQEIPSPSPSGSRYTRGRYQPGIHGELLDSGRSSSQRWKRERCNVAVSINRFGSLDRRRAAPATTCDEVDSCAPVPALLPSQTYPEHTLGHSLVRTQSLGSVESSRPRHQSDRDSHGDPYSDRKTKTKEWYETSLDGPPTTGSNVSTSSVGTAGGPGNSGGSVRGASPASEIHSHPPLQMSLSHPQPNMYQSQSHPQALAQSMYQSQPSLPSHPPPVYPKVNQSTSSSSGHLSLHLPSHPPSPHISSPSHPPAVPPHNASYLHRHSPQPPQPPPLPPPPPPINHNPSPPPLIPPHSRPHSHHAGLPGAHPPSLPPHPPPPHSHQTHTLAPQPPQHQIPPNLPPQHQIPPHHPQQHQITPHHPPHHQHPSQHPIHQHPPIHQNPPQYMQHLSQHSPQHPPQHPSQHPPQHPSQHPPQHPSQHPPQHPPQHPSQHPSQHPPQHPSQHPSQHPPQHHPQHPPQHPPQHHPQHPPQHHPQHSPQHHPQQSPQHHPQHPPQHLPQHPSQHPPQHPPQHLSQHPPQQSSQHSPQHLPQNPPQHPAQHQPPPHGSSQSPIPPPVPPQNSAGEDMSGHSQQNVPFESPKNLMVVQQGSWQPYREVTKPFEMSDFYKYSTKYRKQMQQSPPLPVVPAQPAQSPTQSQTPPALQQKGIYQPLQPLTCQPLDPSNAMRSGSCAVGMASPDNVLTSPGGPSESVADAFSSEMLAWFREQRAPPAPSSVAPPPSPGPPSSSGPPPRSATLV